MPIKNDFPFDFSRSINPAFLEPTSLIPLKAHSLIQLLLPLLNTHAGARSMLSKVLLAAHLRDLTRECADLFFNRKDWNEIKPCMQKTAIAVARLAISIWYPFLYLVGSEAIELITRLDKLNISSSPARSVGEILTQCLYLASLASESPSWQAMLQTISLAKGGAEVENKETILQNAPFVLLVNLLLQGFGILPVLSKGLHTWNLPNIHPSISVLFCLGCGVQALKNAKPFFLAFGLFKHLDPEKTAKYLFSIVASDLAKEAIGFIETSMAIAGVVFPLLELVPTLYTVSEAANSKNYHIGATGTPVRMDDVVGCEEAKACVKTIIDQLANPQKYKVLGLVKPIKGILFFGPPGTGKTMLAKALATEAGNAHFLEQAGSSFIQKYVGEGPKNMRKLFGKATSLASEDEKRLVVVFIDEINGIGAPRVSSADSGSSEENHTTEAFLVEMDRLPPNVVVIGATNVEAKDLDPAFTRSGRFDEHVEFKLPDKKERKTILDKLKLQYKTGPGIPGECWTTIINSTEGWCYADLVNLMEQAARQAGSKGLALIDRSAVEKSLEKLKKRKSGGSSSSISMYT